MLDILEMHTDEEIVKLCEDLGILMEETVTKQARIDRIFQNELHGIEGFREVLTQIWDGILLEYIYQTAKRGAKVKNITDPRCFLLRKWLGDSNFSIRAFGLSNLPVTTRRSDIETWEKRDNIVYNFLLDLRQKEKKVKMLEKTLTRGNRDYRNSLMYFREMAEIRVVEEKFRNYLLDSLEADRHAHEMAAADLIATQDKYHRILQAHLVAASAHVEGEETRHTLRQMFNEIAFAGESVERFQKIAQEQLCLDAFDGEARIQFLKKRIKAQRIANRRIFMLYEDYIWRTPRAKAFQARKEGEINRKIGAELAMARQELNILNRKFAREKRDFAKFKLRTMEDYELASLEIEEVNQRFGKKRRIRKKKKKKGKGKKMSLGVAAATMMMKKKGKRRKKK
eukprot:g1485.t1